MFSMSAVVPRSLRLLLHGLAPRSPAPPLQWPVRAVIADIRVLGSWGRGGSHDRGWASGANGEGEGEEPEEEELLSAEPLLPTASQRVCVLHPDVKGRAGRTPRHTELQVAEAAALVHALHGWSVVLTLVVPTRVPDSRLVFGKGNFQDLTEKIRGCPDITSVFLNVERMATPTKKELEAAWGVEVFDRFTIVLHIFRCNARTKEARLQLALAEIPLLRSTLSRRSAWLDHEGRGSRYIMGSGESFTELRHRVMKEKEAKIRRALERLRDKRSLLREAAHTGEFPIVSVVGYTNCGKTTLIKALTGEAAMQPCNQLFATLDVTAHAGSLPSRIPVLYVDTIGFLSQLPHSLIQSFSATLEDVAHSDVIMHVRDMSHPNTEQQKTSVLSTLQSLQLPSALLDSMLEVHNKVDLVPGYSPSGSGVLAVSALLGHGLDELKVALEKSVLQATGRQVLTLCVQLGGPQLSWLYKEATVQHVQELPETGAAHVTVIISRAAYGRFRKLFPE
ncbi:LOW QUALITY PROTEIN: putative GTP-binding protein 6 [Phodopus roborovskii]|uniref:LOW QUALITY PROTEIN: putative GTP-binding protein 6 n=1 Tax=Phodopus roborovskii TaxID=109678 RepID=UPI0021E4F0CB|nr:LOW QUALITY PROTEIN: putative GTP-binding protein 6 [Phodopus roborovskii]